MTAPRSEAASPISNPIYNFTVGMNSPKMDHRPLFTQQPTKVPVETLDLDHYHPLVGAVRNVLSTQLAEITFAQLLDGLPLVNTVWGMRLRGSLLFREHPLIQHDRLCEGAMDNVRMFRDMFEPAILRFDSPVRDADKAWVGDINC